MKTDFVGRSHREQGGTSNPHKVKRTSCVIPRLDYQVQRVLSVPRGELHDQQEPRDQAFRKRIRVPHAACLPPATIAVVPGMCCYNLFSENMKCDVRSSRPVSRPEGSLSFLFSKIFCKRWPTTRFLELYILISNSIRVRLTL